MFVLLYYKQKRIYLDFNCFVMVVNEKTHKSGNVQAYNGNSNKIINFSEESPQLLNINCKYSHSNHHQPLNCACKTLIAIKLFHLQCNIINVSILGYTQHHNNNTKSKSRHFLFSSVFALEVLVKLLLPVEETLKTLSLWFSLFSAVCWLTVLF